MCVCVGGEEGGQKSKEYWMVYIDVQYKAIFITPSPHGKGGEFYNLD